MKRISLLILSLLFFATAFQSDKLITSGWYQQFFPNMDGSSITSITFLDSLTGFAVTSTNSSVQGYILRTSNGGDNWNIVYTYTPVAGTISFNKIAFADANTGYATVNYYPFFKTTNAGLNWFIVSNTYSGATDMSVINKDTILLANSDIMDGGVYRTTNGGYNWARIWTGGTINPISIYMFNKNFGFIRFQNNPYPMQRTKNGGVNWFAIPGETYTSIMFVDSLTGWKVTDSIKKTTNGGLNWYVQRSPNIGQGFTYYSSFSSINKDTVWMGGAYLNFKGILYKTTNGGTNWGYQIPDSTLTVYSFGFIQFVNDKIGWICPASFSSMLHTTTSGNDTTFFTGIKLVPSIVPEKYSLGQNYPNPFNPTTNIPFELKEPSHVTLKVFDARGREVKELVNGRWGTGKFIADFDASALSTGIYFYQIIVSGESTHQTFTETKKMMVLK